MSDLTEATASRSLAARLDEANAASNARDWPRAAALWDECAPRNRKIRTGGSRQA
jgi:hypothetical protein